MTEVLQRHDNTGELTVATDKAGEDSYDFGSRAIIVREMKEGRGLGEFDPLPSPRTVEIEPTLLCNARCHFCSYEQDIQKFTEERLQLPMAERSYGLSRQAVIKLLGNLQAGETTAGIFWSGGGDPLMWPDIVEAVKYAATFADNSVQTNGIGLGKFFKNPTEDLGAIKLLTVSVYADNPELHAKIAGVSSFDKVIHNLERARTLRDEHGLDTTITAKIMVDAHNYQRLPEIVRFYRELGVDSVGMREVQDFNYGGKGQRPLSVELTGEQKAELCRIIGSHSYKDASLDNFATVASQGAIRPTITSRCFNATDGHFACVDARGDVFLGNPEIGDPQFSIGNVLRSEWKDIWKGPRHMDIIRHMNAMQVAGTCASALCRHVKANVGVQKFLDGEVESPDRAATMGSLGAFL